jgi:LuxR family maltose regulon positive regulatory protein
MSESVPLLLTKLHVPLPRAEAVVRSRLSVRLSRAGRSRLTVVSAPAGFGKTTLLMQWLAADQGGAGGRQVAWVSLDERDNDVTTFWTYVITALQSATMGRGAGDTTSAAEDGRVGAAALAMLGSPEPASEAALGALLNDLHDLPHDVVLVLDDYHVIDARAIHDGMAHLLAHLPPQVHLVLATRADPPLPLARLRARGELVEVRSADLRFTREEAAAYLAGPMGLSLTPADVATLADRTEGWAAALQLAGLSLQDRDDPGDAVARFAGDDRFIVDYLADEVLARQPGEVRDFLLSTSVLDRLTGPLCDAVTGRSGGTARLVALERANLFLVPLDDRRQWYRYHHLFADVLRVHLSERDRDQIDELHRRASLWFEAHGDVPESIRHALAGNHVARAADLMEVAIPAMHRDRREAELVRWVAALPEEVVRLRPVLGVAFAGALAQVSDFDSVERRLSEVERSLRPDGGPWPERPPRGLVVVDEEAYRSLPASVSMYRGALALASGDLNGTVAQARQALSLAQPQDSLIRAGAAALAGLASWTKGDLAAAHAAYMDSFSEMRRIGYIADILGLCITLGHLRQTQGRLGEALRTYEQALALATPAAGAPPLRGTADMHVGMAEVLLERDDLAGAGEHLAAAEGLGEHKGLPQNPYRRRLVLARLREAEGDLDGALELLDAADRLYNGDYSPNVRPVPAVRSRLQLRRGELGSVDAWVRERGLSAADELSYLREYEHVTLARLLLARHEAGRDEHALGEARDLLGRLLAAAAAGGRDGTVLEVLILQGFAHEAGGDMSGALGAMHRAVTLGRSEGYVRLFADEGPRVATVLKALLRRRPAEPDAGYVRRLVAAAARGQARPSALPAPAGLIEPLSDRELDVLRLLASELSGPDIARHLHVALSTVRTHTKSIYLKLGVTSRRAAVRQAAELDLLARQRRA